MSDQTKCGRCGDWIDAGWDHDFQHLEERKVEALEKIAAVLEGSRATGFWFPLSGAIVDPEMVESEHETAPR